jgi:hypothetical protein
MLALRRNGISFVGEEKNNQRHSRKRHQSLTNTLERDAQLFCLCFDFDLIIKVLSMAYKRVGQTTKANNTENNGSETRVSKALQQEIKGKAPNKDFTHYKNRYRREGNKQRGNSGEVKNLFHHREGGDDLTTTKSSYRDYKVAAESSEVHITHAASTKRTNLSCEAHMIPS